MRNEKRDAGNGVVPRDVLDTVEVIVACGKEAIVKKERGKWVVIENNRHIVYKEQ